jgi:Flp pilus assembly protein TadD
MLRGGGRDRAVTTCAGGALPLENKDVFARLDKSHIVHYERAIDINPNYADAHNNLGNALMQTGRMEEALANFKRALEIKPDFVRADNSRGSFYFECTD